MSHQKTKRIESPIKGKSYSMIRQNNQNQNNSAFNSRLTLKRKPIFNDLPQRSRLSHQSPSRRKIFTFQSQSIQKYQKAHFQKVTQTNQLSLKFGNDQQKILSSSQSSNSISSSSIESNQGLQDIKRKLFPTTPVNKIIHDSEDLQFGRDFLSNSLRKMDFQQSDDSLKYDILKSKIYAEKTVSKPHVSTLFKQNNQQITKRKANQSPYRVSLNFNTPEKGQNMFNNKSCKVKKQFQIQPKKDLAKMLRDLHQQLSVKSQTCKKVNDFSECLRKENQYLRKQNERLQERFLQFKMKSKS